MAEPQYIHADGLDYVFTPGKNGSLIAKAPRRPTEPLDDNRKKTAKIVKDDFVRRLTPAKTGPARSIGGTRG